MRIYFETLPTLDLIFTSKNKTFTQVRHFNYFNVLIKTIIYTLFRLRNTVHSDKFLLAVVRQQISLPPPSLVDL